MTIGGGGNVIVSGFRNKAIGFRVFIGNGAYNTGSQYTGIAAGLRNVANNYSFIGSGQRNQASNCSSVGSGCFNTGSCRSAVGSGCSNYAHLYSFIGSGNDNTSTGRASSVVSGYSNSTNAVASGILGGCNNTITHTKSFVVGSNLTSTATCTTFMNNGVITCSLTVGCTNRISTTVGRIDAKNDVVAFSTSDRRLKENIQPIDNALCKVIGVSGNTFNWKSLSEEEVKTIHGNTGRDVGVIAQEIEEILPEAVATRGNGYKAVNYEKIIPLLIEAIKDQQNQIDELKSTINASSK